ncbi:MAG: hypothetical protein ABI178_02120 [Rhodanobacter sp.]
MSQMSDLLVIAALLLIPLFPAAVLYKALTPKGSSKGKAGGTWSSEGIAFGKITLSFSVVGSTATYVVLFAASIGTYLYLQNQAETRAERIVQSMKDNQAWTVRIPVRLRDADGKALPIDGMTMPQVRVETQPRLTSASANDITFRVITVDSKFPTARFTLPALDPVVLDLNDSNKVRVDYDSRQITGIEPVWIVLRKAYGSGSEDGTPVHAAIPGQAASLAPPATAPASMGAAQ